jgi:hypothetical protein
MPRGFSTSNPGIPRRRARTEASKQRDVGTIGVDAAAVDNVGVAAAEPDFVDASVGVGRELPKNGLKARALFTERQRVGNALDVSRTDSVKIAHRSVKRDYLTVTCFRSFSRPPWISRRPLFWPCLT